MVDLSRSRLPVHPGLLPRFLSAFWRFLKDPGRGLGSKAFAVAAIVYALWPIDLLPDLLPLLGWLDDLGLVGIAIAWLLREVSAYDRNPDVSASHEKAPS
jgi:uncharacterized membrane protein YkvA (DUF1232 family)